MSRTKPKEVSSEGSPSRSADQLEIPASEAFEIIRTAKNTGVPIVPLIGAGLSAESGIPMTSQLIDYFANVKAMIDIKYHREQRRRGYWSPNLLEDDPPSSVYHDYLLRAGWPDPNQLNVELLVEYAYALESSEVSALRKVARQFRAAFVEPAGNTLGGMRLWAIHGMLRRAQPSFMSMFSSDGRHKKCPVGRSVESMKDAFEEAWDRYVDQLRDAARSEREVDEVEAAMVGRLLESRRADNGPMKTTFHELGQLRARALRYLNADWRALMRILTLGNPALADSLFNCLVHRPVDPSPGHELLALLTESLGWNLWLTTNFDNLIEEALRDQGIEPAVFELVDNGPAPNEGLFRDAPSVVKLHGGAFGLRVDESLDVPLDKENLGRFAGYFPDHALVLVLGYGGGDRRVMSLIDHLARWHRNEKVPKILWVSRDGVPKSVVESSRLALPWRPIRVVRYRSGGLFLRELHARLVGRHPAGRTSYPALPMIPPLRGVPAGSGAPSASPGKRRAASERTGRNRVDPDLLQKKVVVYKDRHHGEELLDRITRHVIEFNGYNEVWCELADVATVRDMVSSLFDEFRRLDPDVTPRALLVSTFAERDVATGKRRDAIKERGEFLAEQFAAAMRRGKYVVTIISTGDLGRHPFAHDLDDADFEHSRDAGLEQSHQAALDETEVFYAFLKRIMDGTVDLGASKLLVGLCPLGASHVKDKALQLFDQFPGPRKRSWVVEIPPSGRDGPSPEERLEGFLDRVKAGHAGGNVPERKYVDLLVVASMFRRPRSFINLRDVAQLAGDLTKGRSTRDIVDAREAAEGEWKRRETWHRRFDFMLQELDRNGLLFQVEGGFLWMPSAVRDLLYRGSRPERLRSGFDNRTDQLHELIALQYDELLRQSNSLPALLEVAFHLVTAMRLASSRPGRHSPKPSALQKLCAVLERSRPILLAGPPHRVSDWLHALEDQLHALGRSARATHGSDFADMLDETCDGLRELRAAVLYRANDYRRCLDIRKEQIEEPATPGEDPDAVTLRRARCTLEQGRCLARLSPERSDAKESFDRAVGDTARLHRVRPATRRHDESRRQIRQARLIQVESHLEVAQLYLGRIHIWEWTRRPGEGQTIKSPNDRWLMARAQRRCRLAGELIDQNPDLFGPDSTRMHVRVDLTRARLHMLAGDFTSALRWLDDSHAAAIVGDGSGDWGDLTDIRLQAAETLIFGAAYAADARRSAPERHRTELKAKLDQAGVALKQARSTLLLGRPDPQRWTRLGLIRAFLSYERALLETQDTAKAGTRHREPAKDKIDPKIEEQEFRNDPPLDSSIDTLVQQGLNALGSVCGLCWPDSVRRNEVLLLWFRFLITHHFFRREDSSSDAARDEELEDWFRWNQAADLDSISGKKGIQSFCERLLDKRWPAPSWINALGATRRMQFIGIEKRLRPRAMRELHALFRRGGAGRRTVMTRRPPGRDPGS